MLYAFYSGVGPHEMFEFSGVKLKNSLKIGLKTAEAPRIFRMKFYLSYGFLIDWMYTFPVLS